jgi:hypothetical protein
LLALFALVMMAAAALAADPGMAYPEASEVSDQKAGSILIYNYYTSGATSGTTTNTRINMTNTGTKNTAVHLFFVANSCQVADSFICLTPNQTASFLASDIDPGVTGYLVAIASDGDGVPTKYNRLIGDEYIKLSTGHSANLGAEAISAVADEGLVSLTDGGAQAVINFNGTQFNRIPRVVAADSIPSRADGNDTILVLNRIGGNLATGASTLSSLFGLLYDDAESVYSFSVSGGCQLASSLSNTFPRTTPRFESIIPAGRTGWLKIGSQSDIGILGAMMNANANAGAQSGAFNGGHNLHKLTLSGSAAYTIPVFPPSC